MAADNEGQLAAIAMDWTVDPALLTHASWTLETIDGNDGTHYGYFVRFDEATSREVLDLLGVPFGQYEHDVSLNAFDEPEVDKDYLAHLGRRADGKRAYYIDDELFTPSQFRRLSRQRKVQAMVQWFGENFEDPAIRTPFESAGGGYQWIWGGPYSADEQLQDQFSDIADFDVIQEAVAEITSDGLFDWAPVSRREDYVDDEISVRPRRRAVGAFAGTTFANNSFATSSKRKQPISLESLKREMLDRMDELEAVLHRHLDAPMGRGHNHPPELVEIERPIAFEQAEELRGAIAEVRRESDVGEPDRTNVAAQVSILRRVAGYLATGAKWVGATTLGAIIGQIAIDRHTTSKMQIYDALINAADAAEAWLQQLF